MYWGVSSGSVLVVVCKKRSRIKQWEELNVMHHYKVTRWSRRNCRVRWSCRVVLQRTLIHHWIRASLVRRLDLRSCGSSSWGQFHERDSPESAQLPTLPGFRQSACYTVLSKDFEVTISNFLQFLYMWQGAWAFSTYLFSSQFSY